MMPRRGDELNVVEQEGIDGAIAVADLGIYGVPSIPSFDPVTINRKINNFAHQLGTGKGRFAVT
jgi:hypothetical protein